MKYLNLQSGTISSPAFGTINGVAPFKDAVAPYGDFANTTSSNKYSINQNALWDGTPIASLGLPATITWPSSEHAYHGQKLLEFRKNLAPLAPNDPKITTINNMINQLSSDNTTVFLPNNYKTLVEANIAALGFANKTAFDKACRAEYHPTHSPASTLIVGGNNNGLPYTYNYMYHVVKMKLEQHSALKNIAKDFALNGIMPVEISQHDQTWASFKQGDGYNYLGIIILELGNYFLQQEDHKTGAITNPLAAWNNLKSKPYYGFDNFKKYVNNGFAQQNFGSWTEINSSAHTANTSSRPITSSSTDRQTTSRTAIDQNTIQDQIALATGFKDYITKLERAKNEITGQPDVLKITFNDATLANAFATSLSVPQNSAFKPFIKSNRQKQPVVILTEDIAIHFFQNLSLGNNGVNIWNDLKQQPAVGNKRPRSPSPTTSSSYLPRTQTSSSTDPQTPATNVYNPDRTSAHGEVLAATGFNGWITDLKIAPNLNSQHPPVLKITFSSNVDAAAFINANSKPVSEGGSGLILPKSNNPLVVILPKSEAEKFFAAKGILKHGITKRNTWSSLEWEEKNSNNNTPKKPRPNM